MAKRVVQRARARQEIRELTRYVAGRNPAAATELFKAYKETLTRLANFPEIGWPYTTLEADLTDIRTVPISLQFRHFLIFYRYEPAQQTVEIIRVLYATRDIAAALRRDMAGAGEGELSS